MVMEERRRVTYVIKLVSMNVKEMDQAPGSKLER